MAVQKIVRDFSIVTAFGGGISDFIDEVVPPNCKYIIRSFGNDVGNIALWTFAHWRFLVNGIPVFPLDDIYDQMGYSAQRQGVQNIEIPGGSRFIVRGINDHAAITAAMLISIEYDIVDNVG